MRAAAWLSIAALLVSGTGCASAADREFNGVVHDVSQRYHLHATKVPMMSLVSLCARVATHGGVKGLRVAEFGGVSPSVDMTALSGLVRANLGPEWQPFITEQSRDGGEQSVIYVRPMGKSMRMLIADYDGGELDVVRMELNGAALAKWVKEPKAQAHSGHHGAQVPGM